MSLCMGYWGISSKPLLLKQKERLIEWNGLIHKGITRNKSRQVASTNWLLSLKVGFDQRTAVAQSQFGFGNATTSGLLPISCHIGIKMKFFNWMQSKFNTGQGQKTATHHMKQEPRKEEFSDWPHGLLAIGTFGNNDLPRENEEIQDTQGTTSSSPDLSEFTPEEIGKLQKELTKLLSKKPAANKQAEIAADLPLDRFLNCPSSLEVDRRLSTTVISNPDEREEDIDRTIRVILGRCKDICLENSKKAIGKKSISFLLKKMFVCSSGFPPTPRLQDRLPESRMERLLRAMLKNKINAQNSSRASSTWKLIENKPKKGKGKATEKDEENANDGSKWVKTDSEYIVLEI